eukprot:symbB.v1.2.034441.t1/scaffold4446.1/size39512/3
MLSDVGDMVCCLSGVGMATPMSIVPHGGSAGVLGLSRPPSRCEMLPGPGQRRRNKPFEEITDRLSFEGLLKESPLRLFRNPGRDAEPSQPAAVEQEEEMQMCSSEDLDALEGPVEIVNEPSLREVYYLDDRIVEGPGDSPTAATAMSVWYLV